MADAHKKTCTRCGELKPVSDFYTAGRRAAGGSKYLKPECKICTRAGGKRYRESLTPDERRFQSIKYNYGIGRDEYIDMLLAQDFKCPICTKPLDFETLQLDHCHETGQVRGILDIKCNTALGKFEDNIATLTRAQAYLEVARAKS